MQKTLFILAKEANENLEYIQGLLLQTTEMSEEDKRTLQELIRRCQMFKTQADATLYKMKNPVNPVRAKSWMDAF
jgi:hypothetical protein